MDLRTRFRLEATFHVQLPRFSGPNLNGQLSIGFLYDFHINWAGGRAKKPRPGASGPEEAPKLGAPCQRCSQSGAGCWSCERCTMINCRAQAGLAMVEEVKFNGLVCWGKLKPETIDFPMKYGVFRLKCSLNPIH